MKLALFPKDLMWWAWLVTVALLATGLAGVSTGFLAAIALSLVQTLFFWRKTRSVKAISVQIRLSYTLLLSLCFLPQLRWLYWLPAVGTSTMLLFGYCLMARMLSLLPWNRTEPLTGDLLRRTFFTAPAVNAEATGSACGGADGVCELESRVACLSRRSALAKT